VSPPHHLIVIVGVITLVASILPTVALFQVFDFLNGVSGGIMRARGMQVHFRVSSILEQKNDDLCWTGYWCFIEHEVCQLFVTLQGAGHSMRFFI
jgi:hypothetical protein